MNCPVPVECPRCKETFRIAKSYGIGIVCPYCGMGSEAEWFQGPDREECRLVAPNPGVFPDGQPGVDFPGVSIQTLDHLPPTGVPEAMAMLVGMMHEHMGIPPHLMKGPMPMLVDLRQRMLTEEETIRFIQQTTISEPFSNVLEECDGQRPSIRVQAEMMGMRVFNNRKRMRKRVRQRRRHFDPYEEHWTNNPNGDW